MRRKLALFLAVLMSVATMAGCGQENVPAKTSESQPKTSTEAASKETEDVRENVTIELVCFQMPTYQDTFYDYLQYSPVYQELVKQTGVELEVTGLDTDQTNIRISGGEIGDLVMIRSMDELNALIEADLIMPWNELVEEYAPNIKEDYPEAWEWSTTTGGRDGQAYCLSIASGQEGAAAGCYRYLYTVHWDLYKELGYPEITDEDSLLEVLADMVALQPTTADGKPVYGVSFALNEKNYKPMTNNIAATYGICDLKDHYVYEDLKTSDVIYDFANENGPFWMATEYYNKAFRMGILDPDCFTQTEADYTERVKSGEILTGWSKSLIEGYNTTNGNGDGFVIIPVEDTMLYQNSDQPAGWGVNYGLCISKDCEYPERIAEMLAYTFTDEGSRMLRSGVEGVHWDYVDGVPTYNEETFRILSKGTDEERAKEGISYAPLCYFAGKSNGEITEDGYRVGMQQDGNYMSRLEQGRYAKEYSEYFGVSAPFELLENLTKEGKVYDMSIKQKTYDGVVPTEDVARIDSVCMGLAKEAIPKLVMATSAEEYQQIKADTLAKMAAAGAEEAEAFYVNTRK